MISLGKNASRYPYIASIEMPPTLKQLFFCKAPKDHPSGRIVRPSNSHFLHSLGHGTITEKILKYLASEDEPRTTKDIANTLGYRSSSVSKVLRQLYDDGVVCIDKKRKYNVYSMVSCSNEQIVQV